MAIELATAYVSLVASGRGIAKSIATELGGPLERAAKIAGARVADIIGREVESGAKATGTEAGDSLTDGLRRAVAGFDAPTLVLDDVDAPSIGQPVIPEPVPLDIDTLPAPEIGQPKIPEPNPIEARNIDAPKIGQPEIPEPDSSALLSGAKKAGIAAGVAAGAGLTVGFVSNLGAEVSNDKLAAQLGIDDPTYARDLGRIAGRIYAAAWGESLAEVNVALRAVLQNGLLPEDAADADILRVTTKVLGLADAFEQDLGGSAKAAGQLIKTGMADNADEALDIIVRGFQQGLDRSEDFLDTLTEYGTQFRKLGIEGPKALGLLRQGLAGGARDADIVADAIKEFSIRVVDGSELTAEGFRIIGLDAERMARQVAQGGNQAATGLDLVLDRLRAVPDPILRAQAAVALFGTQAEDLGDALFSLDPSTAVDSIGQITGAAERMNEVLGDNAQSTFESFRRTLELKLAGAASFITPVVGGVAQLGEGLGGLVLAAPGLRSVAGRVADVVSSAADLSSATTNVGKFAGALGRVGAASAVLGTGVIAVDALTDAYQRLEFGARPALPEFTRDLLTFSQTGRVTGELAEQLDADLGGLADAIDDLNDRGGDDPLAFLDVLGAAIFDRGKMGNAREDIDALDKALAGLVAQGQEAQASVVLDKVLRATGLELDAIEPKLDDYRAALAESNVQAQLMGSTSSSLLADIAAQGPAFGGASTAADGLTEALGEQAEAAEGDAAAFDSLSEAFDRLIGSQVDAERTAIAYSESHQRLAASVAENGRSLDLATAAGRANRSAILDIIEAAGRHVSAMQQEGSTTDQLRATFATHREELARVLSQLGLNKAEADRYLGLLDQIPESALTTVRIDTTGAKKDLDSFVATIRSDTSNILTGLSVDFDATKVPGREHGGRVRVGQPYVVGEKRPELFVPDRSGTILPEVPGAPARSRTNHYEFTGPIHGLTLEQVIEEAERRSRLAALAGEG